ncbi:MULTISPECIES: helix-turn-helix domain-containing protein [Shewanella]|uniref:helix-turn-helix domain-containing protein n=2 Tax=Shewanellaceae TaxID=267890 RepID=UPI0021D9A641|nr:MULTISPECIES: helix-turn-helix transcriptional regulator [Shewanella]MCU7988856.1 helix-turn-helix domain-containing protein [Shewanella sp. SW24]MCU8069132.1 helix-turn-helix domain-containing protein [Shewanella sp. SM32]WVI95375.1 helix-turn-helix transcriptional regulator [Shewanella oncorhynchi]WVI95381.1 helix-turn-helix transcriptional regulator [Shewanella oncorhynchi]
MENLNMSIGSVLKDRRIALNIKQEDIAEQLGLTVQTVSKWERDLTEPKASQVTQLSQLLKITEKEICSGEIASETRIDPIGFMKKVASIKVLIDDVTFTSILYECIDEKTSFLNSLEKALKDSHGFGSDDLQKLPPSEVYVAEEETKIENKINREIGLL